MRVLLIGDVVGRPGRDCMEALLPPLIREKGIDFVIANGENAAGGVGITPEIAQALLNQVDVLTSGNHIWDKKQISDYISHETRLLRPANYPKEVTPGRGFEIYKMSKGYIGVLNLAGRIYLPTLDCPFRAAEEAIAKMSKNTSVIIVDFHAEATSEKVAMGWFLDGRVTAVIGTHTHVQTADARLLPRGTAYITDVGMTGPRDSVIGVEIEPVLQKYLTQRPVRFYVGKSTLVQFNAVLIDVDSTNGRAIRIERIEQTYNLNG